MRSAVQSAMGHRPAGSRHRSVVRHARRRAGEDQYSHGFTLLELLIAMAILTVITAIVYATFSSVINSINTARLSAEELRLRQFLTRYFNTAFASVYYDSKELAAGSNLDQRVYFEGVDEDGSKGPADTLVFYSTAPLLGGMGLPGDVKEVRIEVIDSDASEEGEFDLDQGEDGGLPYNLLQVLETPWLASGASSMTAEDAERRMRDSGASNRQEALDEMQDAGFEAPSWTVPVETFDVKYYNGADWLDEWNWEEQQQMMPWAVHIGINFVRPEAEREAEMRDGLDMEEFPDFEMTIPIPAGMGVVLTPPEWPADFPPHAPAQTVPRGGGESEDRDGTGQNGGARDDNRTGQGR